MGGGQQRFTVMTYENIFNDSMNSRVALKIFLFDLEGITSSPHKIIESNFSLERLENP